MHSCQRNNANWLRASASWRREYFMWIFVYGNSDRTGRWFFKKVFSFLWEGMERKQSFWWHEVKGISFQPQIKFRACVLSRFSHVRLFVTPRTGIPLSMGFSRQWYWSGLPFPSPGELPSSGTEPRSGRCFTNWAMQEAPERLCPAPFPPASKVLMLWTGRADKEYSYYP